MRKCLCAAAVFFLFGWGAACGDLSEIDDNRIREFVKTAKRVIIDELMTDGNSEDDIDDKIDVIVDVLQGDSGYNGGTTTPLGVPACRETGRKTVAMFRDPAGHISDYLNDVSGFACVMTSDSAACTDGDDVCECEADDTMNPTHSTSFTVSCTEDGGDGETFNFTDAETLNYDAPSGGGTPPSSSNAGAYRIEEQNQNQKNPGMVFPITVINRSGTTVTPSAQASLSAYDSSGSEIDDALAMWKTAVGDNIYDVIVAAGVSASFDVFLVRDTSGVAKIGGSVDGTPIDKVTLTAGNYSGTSDILAINDTSRGNITFMFSGAARIALNDASKAMSYVITDANGEVITSTTATTMSGLDIPGAHGTTFVAQKTGSCVAGQYVMIRIGSNLNKIYLPRCQASQ